MWPPRLNGSIAWRISARPQSAPTPLGPHILCAEKARKSQSSACTSTAWCGAACAASTTMIAPCSCAQAESFSTGLIVPSAFETRPVATTFTLPPRADLVEPVEVDLAAVGDREHRELGARAARDVLPRDEVGVVLELRDDDEVAWPEVREAPGVGDEVDRLGRVAGEDHLARRRRVDELRELAARALERRRRALRERVDAAVHVRVRGLVERGHRVEHLPRLLGGRGRVQVRERMPVELLLEDREVRAQTVRVELRLGAHGHGPIVPSGCRAAGGAS